MRDGRFQARRDQKFEQVKVVEVVEVVVDDKMGVRLKGQRQVK